MVNVGTNQGVAYSGQEGKGKAFILPEGDDSMLAFQQLLKGDAENKDAIKKEKLDAAKKEKETKAKLKEEVPDWWLRHDTEMQGLTDKVLELGAGLMAAGVEDPMAGTDPGSALFKKELNRLKSLGGLSKQYKGQFEEDRKVILADKDNHFTEESKDALVKFYDEKTLAERLVNGDLPPRLLVKEPEFKRAEYNGKLAEAMGKENKEPTVENFKNMVKMAMNDPSAKGYQDNLFTDITNLENDNPDAFLALEEEAKLNNMTPMEMLGTKHLQSYFDVEPVDITATIEKFMPAVDTNKWSNEDKDNITEFGETQKLDPVKLTKAATAYLDFNPKALTQLTNSGLAKDKASAVKYIEELMKARSKELTSSGVRREGDGYEGTGYGEDDIKKAADEWFKYLSGGGEGTAAEKFKAQKKAAEFLRGIKGIEGETFQWGRTYSAAAYGIPGVTTEYGSEDDYNPDKIAFGVLREKKVKTPMDDGSEVTETVMEDDVMDFQFTDPTKKNYLNFDAALPYFVKAVKNQGRLFEPDLGRGPDETEAEREATKKEISGGGLKSKTKEQRESKAGALD